MPAAHPSNPLTHPATRCPSTHRNLCLTVPTPRANGSGGQTRRPEACCAHAAWLFSKAGSKSTFLPRAQRWKRRALAPSLSLYVPLVASKRHIVSLYCLVFIAAHCAAIRLGTAFYLSGADSLFGRGYLPPLSEDGMDLCSGDADCMHKRCNALAQLGLSRSRHPLAL